MLLFSFLSTDPSIGVFLVISLQSASDPLEWPKTHLYVMIDENELNRYFQAVKTEERETSYLYLIAPVSFTHF